MGAEVYENDEVKRNYLTSDRYFVPKPCKTLRTPHRAINFIEILDSAMRMPARVLESPKRTIEEFRKLPSLSKEVDADSGRIIDENYSSQKFLRISALLERIFTLYMELGVRGIQFSRPTSTPSTLLARPWS